MGNTSVPDDFQELGTKQMNPAQVAALSDSSDVLPLLLRHLQIVFENNPEEITKIIQIIHSEAKLGKKKSSLLLDVMTNKNMIKSENLLVVFEDSIHKGKSIDIQSCVYRYMGSSKVSAETVDKIKEIRPLKKKDCWPITKVSEKMSCKESKKSIDTGGPPLVRSQQ